MVSSDSLLLSKPRTCTRQRIGRAGAGRVNDSRSELAGAYQPDATTDVFSGIGRTEVAAVGDPRRADVRVARLLCGADPSGCAARCERESEDILALPRRRPTRSWVLGGGLGACQRVASGRTALWPRPLE